VEVSSHPFHPCIATVEYHASCAVEERLQKSISSIVEQSGAGYCAIGYHTAVNRASVGTAYAWYTRVIERKASREKKWPGKAHLSDNEIV
jgi:hypothetical protein